MSLHISVVAIQGDHIDRAAELLGFFGYGTEATPIEVAGWDAASRYLGDHRCKAIYSLDDWTAIVDPELVLMLDEDACSEISRRFASQVCGLVCEGVSGNYGFNLFRGGRKVRGFCSTDGSITEDAGEPILEELEFDRRRASEVRLIAMVGRIGFDYWGLERAGRILIYGADQTSPAPDATSGTEAAAGTANLKVPWWRFW
jgi:hypothetical protein